MTMMATTKPLRHGKAALLLLTSVAVLAAAQDGGMPDFGQAKVCPPFRCTSGHSAVPRSRPKYESAGCNAMSSGMQMFSAAGADDHVVLGPCCDRWHACYQICGSSKQQCDDAFKKCGETGCGKLADEQAKKDCDQMANMNSMMLQLGDCRKFDESQRSACQCVASDKVKGYRKDAIRGFYKKYAPDALDDEKVKSLAEKADTRAKMAGLFQKLVAKYPKCIKKVKDPQQAYMEDMMRKVKEEKKEEEPAEESGGGIDDSEETQEL